MDAVLTREDVVNRREALSRDYSEAQTLLFALDGAMQDCDYYLELLDAREAEAVAEAPEEDA